MFLSPSPTILKWFLRSLLSPTSMHIVTFLARLHILHGILHLIFAPYFYTLFLHFVSAPYFCRSFLHLIFAPYFCTLFLNLISASYFCTLFLHLISAPYSKMRHSVMTLATVKQKRNDEQLFFSFMSSFYFSLFLCLALSCTIILPSNHLL